VLDRRGDRCAGGEPVERVVALPVLRERRRPLVLERGLVAEELAKRHGPRRQREVGKVVGDEGVEVEQPVLHEREDERSYERLRHRRDPEDLVGPRPAGGALSRVALEGDAERDWQGDRLVVEIADDFRGRRRHRCYPTGVRSLGRTRPSFAARWDCGVVYREV